MSKTKKSRSKKFRMKQSFLWILIGVLALILTALALIQHFGLPDRAMPDEESSLPALKVMVKNGCGVENLAAEYTEFIKDKNIDVVEIGSTSKPIYNKSIIEVKTNDPQDLARLQKMTGITRHALAVEKDPPVPFIIILGDDFDTFMKP
ncbi:MAG: LytR C-terminal domain-containing protein [Candidatus Cloacimonadaceae bacterium]|nr:LytR C-terminal domain-containing protein [Candidatus Cloacimonadota bacterium]MDX9950177.1 LytR C-terminal domain-containing protein [Candidatus Syntrophosphaera sp.]